MRLKLVTDVLTGRSSLKKDICRMSRWERAKKVCVMERVDSRRKL